MTGVILFLLLVLLYANILGTCCVRVAVTDRVQKTEILSQAPPKHVP